MLNTYDIIFEVPQADLKIVFHYQDNELESVKHIHRFNMIFTEVNDDTRLDWECERSTLTASLGYRTEVIK